MRWTTRIALALLVGVILALTIYAYPSSSGFVTLLFRAAAITGVIALAVVLLAVATKRKPGRLDLILLLSAIGLVAFSWPQLSATADANQLAAEIEEAGETEVLSVLAETETDTGALVRTAFEIRDATDAEVEAIFAGLWDDALLTAITGPAAEDADAVSEAAEAIDARIVDLDLARETIEAAFQAEATAISELDTPLPDSARLTFVDAAISETEVHRLAAAQRLDQIAARLNAAANAASVLQSNFGSYQFSLATDTVVFEPGGAILADAAATYSVALTNIALSRDAEAAIIAKETDPAERAAAALRLVEAASTTP